MKLPNSLLFSLSLFGFYAGFIAIPGLVESGEISANAARWLGPAIIGLSIGVVGGTLHQFFSDVTDIKRALQKR